MNIQAINNKAITPNALKQQNNAFMGTGGRSQENKHAHFLPAFLDNQTNEIFISKFANGCQAPFHCLDGLPKKVVLEQTEKGFVKKIKATIIAGFERNGQFYTRDQAAHAIQ